MAQPWGSLGCFFRASTMASIIFCTWAVVSGRAVPLAPPPSAAAWVSPPPSAPGTRASGVPRNTYSTSGRIITKMPTATALHRARRGPGGGASTAATASSRLRSMSRRLCWYWLSSIAPEARSDSSSRSLSRNSATTAVACRASGAASPRSSGHRSEPMPIAISTTATTRNTVMTGCFPRFLHPAGFAHGALRHRSVRPSILRPPAAPGGGAA